MRKCLAPISLMGLMTVSALSNASELILTDDQKRLIEALLTAPKSAPGIGIGVPSGFGAGEGQVFASLGGTTTEKSNGDSDYDGSASIGMGFGNPQDFVGVELQLNIISLTNNGEDSGVGEQGSGSIKLSRIVGPTSGVSIGVENIATWGDGLDRTDPSVYLAYTNVQTLSADPFNPLPLSLTVGIGNERFRNLEDSDQKGSVGVFGAAALAVHRQIGLILDYNGNYFNAGVSIVPLVDYPVTVTLSAVNVNSVDSVDGGTATGDTEFGGSVGYSWSF